MTRVDFYLLSTDSEKKLLDTVCLLIEKARKAEQSVYVHTRSASHADQLDEALWRYRSSSFIPHLNLGQSLPTHTNPTTIDAQSRQQGLAPAQVNPRGRMSGFESVGEPLLIGLPTGNEAETRVAIGYCHEPAGRRDVLINMSDTVPVFFSRFRRTLEVVSGSEAARDNSRERYRFYKVRGYPLKHHNLT